MVSVGLPMTVMAGSMAAGRHGAGARAENLHLIPKLEAERETGPDLVAF